MAAKEHKALEEGKALASTIGKVRRLLHATIFITGMAPDEFTLLCIPVITGSVTY
jgi:hypothetical protein